MNNRFLYLGTTGLFALAMIGSGGADVARVPDIAAAMVHLGYPAWFPILLGTWKLLGVAAIAAPGLGRLKEWAYAGFFFALTGASASHIAVGDGAGGAAAPLVLLTLAMLSWASRPEDRTVGGPIFPAS